MDIYFLNMSFSLCLSHPRPRKKTLPNSLTNRCHSVSPPSEALTAERTRTDRRLRVNWVAATARGPFQPLARYKSRRQSLVVALLLFHAVGWPVNPTGVCVRNL